MENNFFAKQTRSSKIKANIISEYFPKYCKIILKKPQTQIRYLDLFAGPGVYDDGSISTPILVGVACKNDSDLKTKVRLIFNDNIYKERLEQVFETYFPDGTFAFKPKFGDKTIGEDEGINKYLMKKHVDKNGKNLYPSLLFIDPFGYKGVETLVLAEFLKGWGNEIFLFVNVKRIHAAIENNKFDDLMRGLFPTSFEKVRKDRKYTLGVDERLALIIENLAGEYQNIVNDTLFHTAFRFKEEDNAATSHYILHFTKHSRGYDLVKQIYNEFDNIGAILERDGTYTFDAKRLEMNAPNEIDFGDQNIAALSKQLKEAYTGRRISAFALYEEHQTKTKYAKKHYIDTLRSMVVKGDITSRFTDTINHEVTVLLNQNCILEF